jgi:trehalose 6-phosphate phosphatase
LVNAARAWCESHDGTLVEIKDFAVAIHVRGKPQLFGEALSLGRALVARMPDRLMVQIGVEVVEVRRAGANKGSAVASLMRENPFIGRLPVFVGDDRTDEDGFAEVTRIGGFGLLVGPGRPSIAHHRLRRPANVRQWLSLLTREGF